MIEIGRVIGTEKKPNTAYTFYFWTDPKNPAAKVGIGTLVKVVGKQGDQEVKVYGTVVEAFGFNDLESPLHEFFSIGGDPSQELPTLRPEMRLYQAAVLRREPEEPIGAVPIGGVFMADEADVRLALRTDSYVDAFGIPCGCYGSKDEPIAVHLDERFLLGPEAGHLNITGTSGLAAKTSYILFLLQSIFQHRKDDPEEQGPKGAAALLFNTKGGDLLYIDRDPAIDLARQSGASPGLPPNGGKSVSDSELAGGLRGETSLDKLDESIYSACRVAAHPFKNVRYFAPLASDGWNLNTLRRNGELEENNPTQPFTFGLADVIKHAEVLLNKDDLDAKADAYLQYLNDRFIEGDGHQIGGQGEKRRARSVDELVAIVRAQLDDAESKPNSSVYESHSIFTMRKMYNRIRNFGLRYAGLIAESSQPQGPFDEPFERDTVYVIDVSKLGTEEQDLVFAAFITKLREKMEKQELGVSRMIVMVDELNKYAASGAAETYVVKSLKEIAARGRYLGLTLFGAQQFRSRVDKEVVGNCATHAFGHVEAEELAQPSFSYFSPAVKEKLGSLAPGEILIKHPHFAQPIFLRFPKPVILKGGEGLRRFPQEAERSIQDVILGEVKRLRAPFNACKEALEALSPEKDNLISILRQLRKATQPEQALRILQSGRRAVQVSNVPVTPVADYDPFAKA